MNLKTRVTLRPLTSFLILAFAFALIPVATLQLLAPQLALLQTIIVGFAPMLAAVIVTAGMEGKTGVRRLLNGLLRWRLSARFYSVAFILPSLALLGAWLGLLLFGTKADVITPKPIGFALVAILALLRGPLGEETGFRGFALPLLMRRYSLVPAILTAGGLSALWRLPLLIMAGINLFPGEPARLALFLTGTSVATIALALPLGWLYVKTESLVASVLMRLGFVLVFLFLDVPEDVKALAFAAILILVATLWTVLTRLPLPGSAAARTKLPAGPFIAFQAVALISLLPWFFFWAVFNINNPIAGRDVSILIYFLFGTQWQVPLFLGLVSVGMWGAFVLRFRRAAFAAGVALCLPMVAFAFILLLQFIDYQRIIHK